MRHAAAFVVLSLALGATDGARGQALPVSQSGPKSDAIQKVLSTIRMPPGFHIGLLAIVPNARHLALGPKGKALFVGTRTPQLFAVTNLDGAAQVQEFNAALLKVEANGPCFAPDGTLYLAERNRVLAYPAAESVAEGKEPAATIVVKQGDLIPRSEESDGHSARVCRIGPDNKLYITIGQPYNVPPASKAALYAQWGMGGIIWMNRDGSGREVFASGIRNSVGLDFNPADKTLWFTDNQVDGMGDDVPPGEINRATRAGLNFGFPWYGGGHTRTNEYKAQTPPADVVFPQVEMVAHAADLGMTFYTGSSFPEKYRGGIFSAQHGSWNRTEPIGARVMYTAIKPDGTAGETAPFAEGWKRADGSYAGRPVDVAQMADGSLLVSDDELGAVYKITYDGK